MQKFNPAFLRTNSVANPSAQTTSLCNLGTDQDQTLKALVAKVISLNNISNTIKAYILLLVTYGLRISELTNIHSRDIDNQLNIRIKGLKGSKNRIVNPVYYRECFEALALMNETIGFTYSRFYFYRLFKQTGIYAKYSTNQKSSVTHYPRYLYMKKLNESFNDLELIKDTSGHRNSKNTQQYIDKK